VNGGHIDLDPENLRWETDGGFYLATDIGDTIHFEYITQNGQEIGRIGPK